jgi:hypothetical protein
MLSSHEGAPRSSEQSTAKALLSLSSAGIGEGGLLSSLQAATKSGLCIDAFTLSNIEEWASKNAAPSSMAVAMLMT